MGRYKARTEFLNKSILESSDEEEKRLLSVGFIPESYGGEYERYMEKVTDVSSDTDLDKISNANHFALTPGRVFGNVVAGTGFLNPVLVKGNLAAAVGGLNIFLETPSVSGPASSSGAEGERGPTDYTALSALQEMATRYNKKEFIRHIESGVITANYGISEKQLKKELDLKANEHIENIDKLKKFWDNQAHLRKDRKESLSGAKAAFAASKTAINVENITKFALEQEAEMQSKIRFADELKALGVEIESARKFKSSTCSDTFNFVSKQQEYCYEIRFSDERLWHGTAPSKEAAKVKAVKDRLQKAGMANSPSLSSLPTEEYKPGTSESQKPPKHTTMAQNIKEPAGTQPEVNFTNADLAVIDKLALIDDDGSTPKKKTITVEESIGLYNPGISADEIKAWVWYKRQFGNPMTGWEKYFIGGKNKEINILVKTTRDTTVKDNAFRDVSVIPKHVIVGKKTKFSNEYSGTTYVVVRTETNDLIWLNSKDITEIKSRTEASEEEIGKLVAAGVLIYDGADYFPIPVFMFGDIYKRLRSLKDRQAVIVEKYGTPIYDRQLALTESYKPKMRSFREKIKSLRPHVLSLSAFAHSAEEFGIMTLSDESGVKLGYMKRNSFYPLEENTSLFDAFQVWFRDTVKDSDLKNTTKANVATYYWAKSIRWEKDSNGKDVLTQAEKDERIGSARIASEDMFSEFLATALTYEDSVRLDVIWNERYNAFTNINQFVDKVPIAYAGSTMFKSGALGIRPAQRHGLAFLQLTGSGCISYDVGFGKTLTGILNLAQLMSQGKVKRPLIVVPKPTYKNWLRELFGYWTDGEKTDFKEFRGAKYQYGILSGSNINLNDWFNLSGNHFKTLVAANKGDLNQVIPENTITIVSYKGFEQMGFSRSISDDMIKSIAAVLQQKESFKDVKEEVGFMETVMGWLGLGNKNAVIMVDKVGFDHLTVDEAHNFKNVFPSCGKDQQTGRKLFGISASQSARAVKMFFITQYLQRTHGKNVVLLTATPFINSPLEMYSMLSFIGLDTLNEYNLYNIKKFFENFILETIEYAINVKGEIITKPVIKSFKNLKLLQTILYNHFDYKDNPKEAGVVRPCLVELPNKNITTYIEMNEWQKRNQAAVRETAASVSRQNPGAVLRAIALSLDNAFSPFLFSNTEPESAEDFVNQSPKILYTMGCIKSVKDWHEMRGEDVSGQIIYSNRGKQYFEYIKDFLCSKAVGFKRKIQYEDEILDEVEIITGGGTEAEEDHKELVKDAFNAGIVKVIIGTSAIREGLNLQARSANTYDLYPEWNPTDIHQLKGRNWRQGNKFGYVRFVMPLVINSMDNFIYQKQDEKSKRIASLWNSLGDTNSEELTSDLDPAEIKYELVEDVNEKFKIKHESAFKEAQRSLDIAKERKEIIAEVDADIESLKSSVEDLYGDIKEDSTKWAEYLGLVKGKVATITRKNQADAKFTKRLTDITGYVQDVLKSLSDFEGTNKSDIQLLLKISRELKSRNYVLPTDYSSWQKEIESLISEYKYAFQGPRDYLINSVRESYAKVVKAERSVLNAYDKTWTDDLTDVVKDLEKHVEEAEAYATAINDQKYKDALIQEISAEIEAKKALRGDITSQVDKFIALNYLLSYLSDNTDKEKCSLPVGPCCATLGLDVVYQETDVHGEVESEQHFEEQVYTNEDYHQLIKGLKAVMKFKTEAKEKDDYAKMIKALETVIKLRKKNKNGGVMSYGRGASMGSEKQYSAFIEFDPSRINEVTKMIQAVIPVGFDNEMFAISDNSITVSGLTKKEEIILSNSINELPDVNYQSQEQYRDGGPAGASCGCKHSYDNGGEMNDDDAYGAIHDQIIVLEDKLRRYSPPFLTEGFTPVHEYNESIGKYEIAVNFIGVKSSVIRDLHNRTDEYVEHFNRWAEKHIPEASLEKIGRTDDAVVYVISFSPAKEEGNTTDPSAIYPVSDFQVRSSAHGFSQTQIKNIIAVVRQLSDAIITSEIAEWGSGGQSHHLAIKLKDGRWILFHSATGDVTITTIPFATAEDLYQSFGTDDPDNTTDLYVDGLEDDAEFARTLKIVNSIKNNNFASNSFTLSPTTT